MAGDISQRDTTTGTVALNVTHCSTAAHGTLKATLTPVTSSANVTVDCTF